MDIIILSVLPQLYRYLLGTYIYIYGNRFYVFQSSILINKYVMVSIDMTNQ